MTVAVLHPDPAEATLLAGEWRDGRREFATTDRACAADFVVAAGPLDGTAGMLLGLAAARGATVVVVGEPPKPHRDDAGWLEFRHHGCVCRHVHAPNAACSGPWNALGRILYVTDVDAAADAVRRLWYCRVMSHLANAAKGFRWSRRRRAAEAARDAYLVRAATPTPTGLRTLVRGVEADVRGGMVWSPGTVPEQDVLRELDCWRVFVA